MVSSLSNHHGEQPVEPCELCVFVVNIPSQETRKRQKIHRFRLSYLRTQLVIEL
jgi:hypothetical protein